MRIIVICLSIVAIPAFANVVGSGVQNFNTTTDGLDYVTVQSSKTLLPGIVNLGFFMNHAVNTLPYLESSTQSKVKLNDQLLGADLNAGIGIMERWDAGLSLPFILAQKVNDQGDIHGQFQSYGNTEVRVNTKYRLLGDQDGGLAVVGSVNFNRITDDPYAGHGAGPTTNLELVADRTINRIAMSINFGHRWRKSGAPIAGVPIEPLGDQWIYSAAMSYLFTSLDTKVIGELYGATEAGSGTINHTRADSSLESLLGVKHDLTTALALHGGVGAGLMRGTSSADWRVYAGINYAFGGSEPKGPAEAVAAPLESVPPTYPNTEVFRASNVLFGFDSDQWKSDYRELLANLVKHLRAIQFVKLIIDGHTDSVGNHGYNIDLSRRRANAVRDYLVKDQKFDPKVVEINGYGPDQPVADNGNYQGRRRNRRVEFTIVLPKPK